jgi:hypothetical protein
MSATKEVAKDHVFGTPYLVDLIMESAMWPSLLAFRHAPKPISRAAKKELMRCVVNVLSPFLPAPEILPFLQCIDEEKGVIIGSVVRRLLLVNMFDVSPYDLNIKVSQTSDNRLHSMLTSIGYTRRTSPPAAHYERTVKYVDHYERVAASGKVCHTQQRERRVCAHVLCVR